MVMKNGKMMKCLSISGSSHRIYSVEKPVLKNFANVTGKHLCWNLFLMKSYAFRPVTLLKWDSKIDLFLVKFTKFLRTPILMNICERLLCISYDLHKYVSHVKKNCQRTCAKFMNYLQRFHIIAILENPSKDDLSDSGGTGVAMELLKKTKWAISKFFCRSFHNILDKFYLNVVSMERHQTRWLLRIQ